MPSCSETSGKMGEMGRQGEDWSRSLSLEFGAFLLNVTLLVKDNLVQW